MSELHIHIHEHVWWPDLLDGKLDYRTNHLAKTELLGARCSVCNARMYFTKAQWETMEPETQTIE